VVAVGFPHLVQGDWIKPGAVVLDVGINVVDWGGEEEIGQDSIQGQGTPDEEHSHFHVVGDVDFEQAVEVASAVTPVPGGVGPMTIAAVLHNTVHSAAMKLGLRLEDPVLSCACV